MRNLILIISSSILGVMISYAQVGIGTSTPDSSAILDIVSDSKGVLFPKYNLTDLTDSTSPIMNPAEGLIIYNTGSTHPKGYYIWINNLWNNVITSETTNKVLFLTIPRIKTGTTEVYVLNQSINNNKLGNMELVSTNNKETLIGADQQTITLPAGKYKIEIGGDVIRLTNSTPTFGNYYYRYYRSYIRTVAGTLLSGAVFEGKLFTDFSTLHWVHYIELSETTSLNIYMDTSSTSNTDPITARYGVGIAIYELR